MSDARFSFDTGERGAYCARPWGIEANRGEMRPVMEGFGFHDVVVLRDLLLFPRFEGPPRHPRRHSAASRGRHDVLPRPGLRGVHRTLYGIGMGAHRGAPAPA